MKCVKLRKVREMYYKKVLQSIAKSENKAYIIIQAGVHSFLSLNLHSDVGSCTWERRGYLGLVCKVAQAQRRSHDVF